MKDFETICLLNDSFLPQCDGVAIATLNYANSLRAAGYDPLVVVPSHPDAQVCYPYGVPVYLFVGRMMWYKGIRIILDALRTLQHEGKDFRMVFIGGGNDKAEIGEYAINCGIGKKCIFTGPVLERETLRAWYGRADLFLFPSTFDTNGLVVREAAASCLPSVLVGGSCAAEGILHGQNGFLIGENSESLFSCLMELYGRKEALERVGEGAQRDLYLSWDAAVAMAAEKYGEIIDKYRRGGYPRRKKPRESWLKANGELMEALASLSSFRRSLHGCD